MLSSNTTLFSSLSRRMASRVAGTATRGMASIEPYEDYGKHLFTGAVADEYLAKHGASAGLLKDPTWTQHSSDTVAAAVLDW